ncbi:hypothetical protein, partial [Lysinibacillus sp. UBA6686]
KPARVAKEITQVRGKPARVAKEIAQVKRKPARTAKEIFQVGGKAAQVTEKTTRNQLKVGIILSALKRKNFKKCKPLACEHRL